MPPDETRPDLRGERVCLRDRSAADGEALTRILTEPAVARWWGSWDAQRVREDLGDGWVIVIEGAVAGWLEYSEETEPDYRHVGLDIALTSALHGQAHGPEALRLAIRHFAERGHHRFSIDPAVDNEPAKRAYAKVGFRPVGAMRAYGRDLDGNWHDHLLMDLLVSELAD